MSPSTRRRPERLADRRSAVLLLALLLLVAPAAGQTTASADNTTATATIENSTYTGDGRVSDTNRLLLWQSADHEFTVTVMSATDFDGTACLTTNATDEQLGCEAVTVYGNSTETVPVGIGEWTANAIGPQTITTVLQGTTDEPVDELALRVTVIRRDGDLDGDGLVNEREVALGTNVSAADTDGDTLSDRAETGTYDTSPVEADTDGDGLSDGAEVDRHLTGPTDADTDDDGLADGRELELGTSPHNPDSDGDGLTDAIEVNTYDTNVTRADTDGDGLDDGAEVDTYQTNPRNEDTDGDGLTDALEVYTYNTGPVDPDTDNDGLGDGSEVKNFQTDPTERDTDGDGLGDETEVDRFGTNPLDADSDGDGLKDGSEEYRYGTDPLAVDSDGDGVNDQMEVKTGLLPDGPWLTYAGIGVVLGVALSTVGFYSVTGRVPGAAIAGSVTDRVREAVPRWVTWVRPGAEHGPTTPEQTNGGAASAESDGPPLLSNEERVLQLLDGHEGQMRQSDIVEETEWSKAKVSRLLSRMEEDNQITKIDIGRENIVTRPEDTPQGANPPFER